MRAGRVDLDGVAERCRELGLMRTAEQLPELLEEASREDLTPVRFLERLVEREYERKEERRIEMWLRMSGLPPGKTLDCFDWSFQPRADRAKVPIQERRPHHFVTEDRSPLLEPLVRSQHCRRPLVALVDELEEQRRPVPGHRQVADLVHHQEGGVGQDPQPAPQLPLRLRLLEGPGQGPAGTRNRPAGPAPPPRSPG